MLRAKTNAVPSGAFKVSSLEIVSGIDSSFLAAAFGAGFVGFFVPDVESSSSSLAGCC